MNVSKIKTEFRMLSKLDFEEFRRSATESVDTNMEYLWFGEFFDRANLIGMMNAYSSLLQDQQTDHYGIFEGRKLLGHLAVTKGEAPLGVELYGWVRKGYQSRGIGELGLKYATRLCFEHKNFNFVKLVIDERNLPSRAVAEKVGFKPMYKSGYGNPEHGKTFISYYKINPYVEGLAKRYKRRAIDIMNCPATMYGFSHYLLKSDSLVDFYAWPLPPYVHEGSQLDRFLFGQYLAYVNMTPDDIEYFKREQEMVELLEAGELLIPPVD